MEARNFKLWINNKWVDSLSGETQCVRSPATAEVIARVPKTSREDARLAIEAARAAFETWAYKFGPFDRAALMHRIADQIVRAREQLAKLIALENGKPYLREALPEIDECAENFRIAAEDIKRLETSILPSRDLYKRIWTIRQPNGVYGLITPWNFPMLIPAELIAPALAAGNTIVWKPSEFTPASGLAFAQVIALADLPRGVFNVVNGYGKDVGDELVTSKKVDAIGFVGQPSTGEMIASRAGLKRLLLEMGGNGPTIICDDADLQRAAELTAFGCFYDAGQVCCATERILVQDRVHDEFAKLMVTEAKKVKLGHPLDDSTTMGPLTVEGIAARMDRHVADAIEKGAKVVYGGKRAPGFLTNLYYEPTVLIGAGANMLINQEESFGPIAPIFRAASDDEAVQIANSCELGLQASVFTSSLRRAMYFAERLMNGNVIINDSTDYWEPHVPFGGRAGRRSGNGRIGGKCTILDMTDLKTIVVDLKTQADSLPVRRA